MLWGEGGIHRSGQKWRELLNGLFSMAFIQSVSYIMGTFSVILVVQLLSLMYACLNLINVIYRVEQKERTRLQEGVPYVKVYRKTPKHLYPKLNGFGDNGQ
jgi:hypothetical protein